MFWETPLPASSICTLSRSSWCTFRPPVHLYTSATIHVPLRCSQASLKNYLRAVLAIQHGCVRGSIPVSRPTGGKPGKKTTKKGTSTGGLVEKEATRRAALSM